MAAAPSREYLRTGSVPQPGDFVQTSAAPKVRTYTVSQRILDGLMEDDAPHFKKVRAGVVDALKGNLRVFLPDVPAFTVTFGTNDSLADENLAESWLQAKNGVFKFSVTHSVMPEEQQEEPTLFIQRVAMPVLTVDEMNAATQNILKAITTTAEGHDLPKERKNFGQTQIAERLAASVTDLTGQPTADPAMLKEEVSKRVGGKRRRHTMKKKKTHKKTRRHLRIKH